MYMYMYIYIYHHQQAFFNGYTLHLTALALAQDYRRPRVFAPLPRSHSHDG